MGTPLHEHRPSIGLIAVGLILALPVHIRLGGLDLNLVGWILVVVGVIGPPAPIRGGRY